jgi:hypothetical protein
MQFVLFVSVTGALGQGGVTCPLRQSVVSLGGHEGPIFIKKSSVELSAEQTTSSLWVENRDSEPVDEIFAVAEFYQADVYVLSMIFYAATTQEKPRHHPPIATSTLFPGAQPLLASLMPRDSVQLYATGPVRPLKCPDNMKVTLLETTSSNGKVFSQHAADWRIDATLARAQQWDWGKTDERKPFSALIRGSVDESGKVHVSSVTGAEADDWLADEIEKSWTFLPATYGGVPVAQEVWMLFRFFPPNPLSNPLSLIPTNRPIRAVTIVDVLPSNGGRSWMMYYAGTGISTKSRLEPSSDKTTKKNLLNKD